MPKIISLDVQCEKNLMKVSIKFDKPFYGIIFSKGFYSDVNCVHLPAGVGRGDAQFDIAINSCGTTGNTGERAREREIYYGGGGDVAAEVESLTSRSTAPEINHFRL
jgi:hypothetical protein